MADYDSARPMRFVINGNLPYPEHLFDLSKQLTPDQERGYKKQQRDITRIGDRIFSELPRLKVAALLWKFVNLDSVLVGFNSGSPVKCLLTIVFWIGK